MDRLDRFDVIFGGCLTFVVSSCICQLSCKISAVVTVFFLVNFIILLLWFSVADKSAAVPVKVNNLKKFISNLNICAHRGAARDAPENTMEAFMQACDAGVDAIELDVWLSADGIPVVFNDASVERTTDGTGRVETLNLSDLQRLNAAAWSRNPLWVLLCVSCSCVLDVCLSADGILVVFNDASVERTTDGTGRVETLNLSDLQRLNAAAWSKNPLITSATVPLLEDVLRYCIRQRLRVIIDVKSTKPMVVGCLVDLFKQNQELYHLAAVCSTHFSVVYQVKRRDPTIITGHTWRPGMLAYRLDRCGLARRARSTICRYVEQWRSRGIHVIAWTLNDPHTKAYALHILRVPFMTDSLSDLGPELNGGPRNRNRNPGEGPWSTEEPPEPEGDNGPEPEPEEEDDGRTVPMEFYALARWHTT